MNNDEKAMLFAALVRRGWRWKDDVLGAPNGTLWLTREEPWIGDANDMFERMQGRLERIARNSDGGREWDEARSDTALLVDALGAVAGGAP